MRPMWATGGGEGGCVDGLWLLHCWKWWAVAIANIHRLSGLPPLLWIWPVVLCSAVKEEAFG